MRRHGFDAISLGFGALFAAIGVVFLFGNVDLSRVPPAWSWPIPLMLVGMLIIVLATRRDRRIEPVPEPGDRTRSDPFGPYDTDRLPDEADTNVIDPADEP
jgi:hypothetical protein